MLLLSSVTGFSRAAQTSPHTFRVSTLRMAIFSFQQWLPGSSVGSSRLQSSRLPIVFLVAKRLRTPTTTLREREIMHPKQMGTVPINLVSPWLFVTSEHSWSDRASTSTSFAPARFDGDPELLCSAEVPGVQRADSDEDLPGFEGALCEEFADSCRRRSRSPRSVVSSPSGKRPESFSSDSIRPRRFSRPSMYFALRHGGYQPKHLTGGGGVCSSSISTNPFGGFLFFSTRVNTHSVL